MSNNLIQCGHCNGNAFIDADFGPGWVEYWAECGQCGVRTQEYTTEEQAANIWNSRAGLQITPQAGEAAPHAWVYEFDDPDPQTDIEFGAECPEGWKRHIARGAVYPLYRTAPPRPVAPRVEPTDKQKQLFVQYASRVSKHGYTSENQKIAQRALHKIFALPPDSPGVTEES